MDDKSTYTTMMRIAGSFAMNGPVFEAIMRHYGWKRFVLISDTNMAPCLYSSSSIFNYMSVLAGISSYWLRMANNPTTDEFDDYLQQIRHYARSTY
jgi:hypothetical protein